MGDHADHDSRYELGELYEEVHFQYQEGEEERQYAGDFPADDVPAA